MTVENRWFALSVLCFVMGILVFAGVQRYPVGRPVPAEIYTVLFDPCDPAYRFFQLRYGEPNEPTRWQSAPSDWVARFGDNERTMLLHAVSELRVIVAAQGRRILALEADSNDVIVSANKQLAPLTDYMKLLARVLELENKVLGIEKTIDKSILDPNAVVDLYERSLKAAYPMIDIKSKDPNEEDKL